MFAGAKGPLKSHHHGDMTQKLLVNVTAAMPNSDSESETRFIMRQRSRMETKKKTIKKKVNTIKKYFKKTNLNSSFGSSVPMALPASSSEIHQQQQQQKEEKKSLLETCFYMSKNNRGEVQEC